MKKIFLISSFIFGLISTNQTLHANETEELKLEVKTLKSEVRKFKTKAKELNSEFAGINFGVGLALSFKHGKDRIGDAILVGEEGSKVVRANSEFNRQPKLMLETHYFFQPFEDDKYGVGPFLGIEPDSSGGSVIGAYALGVMFGLKKDGENSSSWNLGIAYVVNTNVKVLGDGITEGAGLPAGETEIRYKHINQPGWLIMTSFTW